MNYGQTKAQFSAVLNRRDITSSLTDTFVKQSIQRAQRLLRVPAMEKSAVISVSAGDEGVNVPGDLLQFINVFWSPSNGDWKKLKNYDIGDVYALRKEVGGPEYFARQDANLVVSPRPDADGFIRVDYYADFSNLSNDTDSNWLTEIAPDIVIYGALSYAADYFLDNRRDLFEQRFINSIDELMTQAQLDELTAAATMSPAYTY